MSYRIRAKLTNPTPSPVTVTIPSGTVFQINDPFARVQNLATRTPITVTVPPSQTTVVIVRSWCLNRSYSPPHGQAMSPTPFQLDGTYPSQSAVWDRLIR